MAYADRSVVRIGMSRGSHSLFAWLLRAVLLALALQVGGVVHGTADVLGAVGVLSGEHEQCPPDGACDDCLAGCPNCHCAAALRTVAPSGGWSLDAANREPGFTPCENEGSSAPLGPTLDSVYRPPRALVPVDFTG